MTVFDPWAFRKKFPFFKDETSSKKITSLYFDSAATMQKPAVVIDALQQFYQQQNANVHRGSYQLSAAATLQFEQARDTVKTFINAADIQEIIWTKGATEAINLVATSWGLANLTAGDEIVLSYAEHHANIVPWQHVAEKTGAKINVLPLNATGIIDCDKLDQVITKKTRIICCAHISNVIGKVNPIQSLIKKAKQVGALTLIDGAQAIAHQRVDVQALDCDFYVFSAHKVYGPMGVGVLYGRKSLLNAMSPYQFGGEMIKQVSIKSSSYNELPFKFEAGTPNVAGCIAFARAIDFIGNFSQAINTYEQGLVNYCYQQLQKIPSLKLIVPKCPDIGIFSFTIIGQHNHDIASALDGVGIAVRSGHHCAMPLMDYLKLTGCIRLSLAPYNTQTEIDLFIQRLQSILADSAITKHASGKVIKKNKLHNYKISDEIIALFSSLKSWDSRHRQIMLLSKELPKLAPEKRNDDNLVQGCESLAWLDFSLSPQETFMFQADSEAKVIRGLLVIVLAAYQEKTAEQILSFDIESYFTQLGLLHHLSPSRSNGLKAIVDKINKIAKESSATTG